VASTILMTFNCQRSKQNPPGGLSEYINLKKNLVVRWEKESILKIRSETRYICTFWVVLRDAVRWPDTCSLGLRGL